MTPRIGRDTWVVLDYALYDEDGDVIEATDEEGGRPLGFVWGYGSLVPGLERALQGMAAGETKDIEVAPEDAYGPADPELEHWVDRADFPEDLQLDDEFVAEDEQGEEITLRVVEIEGDAVLVDGNHPLAGQTLRFDVMVRSVRPATAQEIAAAKGSAPKTRLSVLSGAPAAPAVEAAAAPKGSDSDSGSGGGATHPSPKGLRKDHRSGSEGSRPSALPAELEDEQ